MNDSNLLAQAKIVKNFLISTFLFFAVIIICKHSFRISTASYSKDDCIEIKFDDKAIATRCKDYVEIRNIENDQVEYIPSSIAQALAISAKELAENQSFVFHNILDSYNIKINDTHVYMQKIDLALKFFTYKTEFEIFGSLIHG